jgi:hypothetical protein
VSAQALRFCQRLIDGGRRRFRPRPRRPKFDEEMLYDHSSCGSRWLANPLAHVRLRKGARTTELADLLGPKGLGMGLFL